LSQLELRIASVEALAHIGVAICFSTATALAILVPAAYAINNTLSAFGSGVFDRASVRRRVPCCWLVERKLHEGCPIDRSIEPQALTRTTWRFVDINCVITSFGCKFGFQV